MSQTLVPNHQLQSESIFRHGNSQAEGAAPFCLMFPWRISSEVSQKHGIYGSNCEKQPLVCSAASHRQDVSIGDFLLENTLVLTKAKG